MFVSKAGETFNSSDFNFFVSSSIFLCLPRFLKCFVESSWYIVLNCQNKYEWLLSEYFGSKIDKILFWWNFVQKTRFWDSCWLFVIGYCIKHEMWIIRICSELNNSHMTAEYDTELPCLFSLFGFW